MLSRRTIALAWNRPARWQGGPFPAQRLSGREGSNADRRSTLQNLYATALVFDVIQLRLRPFHLEVTIARNGEHLFERRHRRLAAPYRLRIVAERDHRAGMAGELGNQSNFDPLRLHARDEQMASRMGR